MQLKLNMLNTIKGSMLEKFYPAGWDLRRIDRCCGLPREKLLKPASYWNDEFQPVPVENVAEMDRQMGDAIAEQIESTRAGGRELALILPVGPMGMYKQVVTRILKAGAPCDHVHTFNMDEWSTKQGVTIGRDFPGAFEQTMRKALFEPLGKLAVPEEQRYFATRRTIQSYARRIDEIRLRGGRLVTVYGIGRTCHIAFWEPHLAAKYSASEWRRQTHQVGIPLHPLTIEQNAITSFNSRMTQVPCYANSIGPGLFLQSDYCIGGADGAYPQFGQQWQGMSLCVTLQYGTSAWLPSTFMPTLPGRLFFVKQLSSPLVTDAH
jgi:glucosamine-6-phosphate deaminase